MNALARITIYPIKSLDGVDLDEAEVLASGALRNDRRWAIVDGEGRVVNGKRTAAIHTLRTEFASGLESVTLSHPETPPAAFQLATELAGIGEWISDALQIECKLVEDRKRGFPDDLDAAGPTLVSTGTLTEVADWFALSQEETHCRFRPNLVIDAAEPFWEDQLVGELDRPVPFTIGDTCWLGANSCQRCVVPARDSRTGEARPRFQRDFASRREAKLPTSAPRERFDHFYRLAVNTRTTNHAAGRLRLGDELRIEV